MPSPSPTSKIAAPLRGILLMLASGAILAMLDATGKYLTRDYSIVQISWARYTFHMLCVPALVGGWRPAAILRTRRLGLQIARSVLLLASTLLFFLAVKLMPLADVAAITMIGPLIVTGLSVPLLGEKVGRRRWSAVVVGFLGALVIIRPGFGMAHWAAILPVVVAACYALYQISTRVLSRSDDPSTTIFYTGLVGVVVTTALVPFDWRTPDLAGWVMLVPLGVFGSLGHFLVIRALGLAPASMLAPLGYVPLIWATMLGFAVFGDLPDLWTFVGAAIVTGSGLYVLYRERKLGAAERAGPARSEPATAIAPDDRRL